MEKRDIIVILAAIVIVLIMAVVVKPMLTGQPVVFLPESPPPVEATLEPMGTSIPGDIAAPPINQETPYQTPSPDNSISPFTENTGATPATHVTPVPTPMTWQPDPDNPMPAIQMTNYAEIVGKYTGLTSPFRIPTPYWELHYNVTPVDGSSAFSMDVREVTDGKEKTIRTLTWRDGKTPDPRDFRFFEGGREYYISIMANQLKDYRITIQIPLKYIRDT